MPYPVGLPSSNVRMEISDQNPIEAGIGVETSAYSEQGLDLGSGDVTPTTGVPHSSPTTRLSLQDAKPAQIREDPQLSYKQILAVSGLLLLLATGFAISSGQVQFNKKRLARSYSDVFDPSCIDKLSDSGYSSMARAFDVDLIFGNFTFTQAKVIDVAWDTTIGQGGRLLHGWILYRCVMRRLLIDAMEHNNVPFRYYFTVSWSQASIPSFGRILGDIVYMKGWTTILCTILLVYALGYTILFPLLWSTATGYFSLSHRLYAMPDADIVPLNTRDLALCWVLDGSRLNMTGDHIEMGPDFSAIGSLVNPLAYTDKKHCINGSTNGNINPTDLRNRSLVYTSGGWKVDTTTTVWDHFGLSNGSNNIGDSSENFQSIRACG